MQLNSEKSQLESLDKKLKAEQKAILREEDDEPADQARRILQIQEAIDKSNELWYKLNTLED